MLGLKYLKNLAGEMKMSSADFPHRGLVPKDGIEIARRLQKLNPDGIFVEPRLGFYGGGILYAKTEKLFIWCSLQLDGLVRLEQSDCVL